MSWNPIEFIARRMIPALGTFLPLWLPSGTLLPWALFRLCIPALCAGDLSPASPEAHRLGYSALQIHRRLTVSPMSERHWERTIYNRHCSTSQHQLSVMEEASLISEGLSYISRWVNEKVKMKNKFSYMNGTLGL